MASSRGFDSIEPRSREWLPTDPIATAVAHFSQRIAKGHLSVGHLPEALKRKLKGHPPEARRPTIWPVPVRSRGAGCARLQRSAAAPHPTPHPTPRMGVPVGNQNPRGAPTDRVSLRPLRRSSSQPDAARIQELPEEIRRSPTYPPRDGTSARFVQRENQNRSSMGSWTCQTEQKEDEHAATVTTMNRIPSPTSPQFCVVPPHGHSVRLYLLSSTPMSQYQCLNTYGGNGRQCPRCLDSKHADRPTLGFIAGFYQ